MPLPWLHIIDGVIGATDLVRRVRGRPQGSDIARGGLESKLAGVVVGALREAFDRDHERLEIDRQRIDEQRERAERAERFEMLRQAGEREIGRMRVLTAVAIASWAATLVLVPRLTAAGATARVALGLGWLSILGALAMSLAAQGQMSRGLARADERALISEVTASGPAAWVPGLIVAGLGVIALAVIFL